MVHHSTNQEEQPSTSHHGRRAFDQKKRLSTAGRDDWHQSQRGLCNSGAPLSGKRVRGKLAESLRVFGHCPGFKLWFAKHLAASLSDVVPRRWLYFCLADHGHTFGTTVTFRPAGRRELFGEKLLQSLESSSVIQRNWILSSFNRNPIQLVLPSHWIFRFLLR